MNAASVEAQVKTAAATEPEYPLALARRLDQRLEQLPRAAHELRLARALMLDVIELLEAAAET